MNLTFLPTEIYSAIIKTDLEKLYEIRLRVGFPISIIINNIKYFLAKYGLSTSVSDAIICVDEHIDFIIKTVCEHSVYAYNDKICNGYITTKDGIRIGLAGECVFDKDKIVTIKNFSSINIRVPHEILGCANEIFDKITCGNNIYNSLIISPPFCGKTTILKDIARILNERYEYSILLIDERGEFAKIKGRNIDVISYSDKEYAFNFGVRAMSPSIVITDELATLNDWNCVKSVANSGVKIIASIHAGSMQDVLEKRHFIKNIFNRFVVLKSVCGFGLIENVYDKEYNSI